MSGGLQAQREQVQRVKQAAKIMTLGEAVRALGMGHTELHRMSNDHGFQFIRSDKERLQREIARRAKAEERKTRIALLSAESGKDLSPCAVGKRLGVSTHTVTKLSEEHGLAFPRYGSSK